MQSSYACYKWALLNVFFTILLIYKYKYNKHTYNTNLKEKSLNSTKKKFHNFANWIQAKAIKFDNTPYPIRAQMKMLKNVTVQKGSISN